MPQRDLASFRAMTFDIIGTLIDYETGVLDFFRPRLEAEGISPSDDEVLEAYAREEKTQQELHPDKNTMDIFMLAWPGICKDLGLRPSAAPAEEYIASAKAWEPFPDSIEALDYLKQHYTLAAITTGSQTAADSFQQKLQRPFVHLFTADLLGYAKPDKRAFHGALDRLAKEGIAKEDILHVAQSQYHDIPPAKEIGLPVVWIERRHGRKSLGGTPIPDGGIVQPDHHATSMADFVAQIKKAKAQ
ncbi:hypothetical protein WJX73_000071 [Symbiochloris irregularis]|uniref:Uncharacterized protein n=1 Tax=Symbiochloris irregularis TaxID=706552 RepID=A0AAW1P0Z9_9CHLO